MWYGTVTALLRRCYIRFFFSFSIFFCSFVLAIRVWISFSLNNTSGRYTSIVNIVYECFRLLLDCWIVPALTQYDDSFILSLLLLYCLCWFFWNVNILFELNGQRAQPNVQRKMSITNNEYVVRFDLRSHC